MNVVVTRKPMTVREFLKLPETDEKLELLDGEIVSMTPATRRHARTAQNIFVALRMAIEKARLPCEAFINEPGVVVSDNTMFISDVLVECGQEPDDDGRTASPVIVVEVVSPSSRGVDTGTKFFGYFRVSSVRHYLVVNAIDEEVCHHRLEENGTVRTVRLASGDTLAFDPPGLAVAVADFFGRADTELAKS